MSRRHSQDRALTQTEVDPAYLLPVEETRDEQGRPKMPWWYATEMPEPWDGYLWHQWPSAWAEVTLRVCDGVWRRQGARIYAVHRDVALRDDLYDWLIVQAVEAQADFVPRRHHPAPEANWGAWLRARLTEHARYHFGQVMGNYSSPSGRAAAEAHNRGIYSTERLDELQAETGFAPTRHPLHGEDFLNRDPASIIIRLDELASQADKIERDNLVSGTYSTSSTVVGQTCLTVGCDRPSVSRGMCKSHYLVEWRRTIANCSIDGCETRESARGLCTRHYAAYREEQIAAGTWVPYNTPTGCSVDGCDATKVEAKGMCSRHYEKHRRAQKGPCSVDGCDNRASGSRGMCPNHYRLSRLSTTPCSEDGCSNPQAHGTLCATHYHRRRLEAMPPCSEEGCTYQAKARGLCSSHYKRDRARRKAEENSA